MTSEQKQKLLKAKVAAALHNEISKVPSPSREQIEDVTLLVRVLCKAVLGVHFTRQEQMAAGQLPIC
jgi:hypothetical protein